MPSSRSSSKGVSFTPEYAIHPTGPFLSASTATDLNWQPRHFSCMPHTYLRLMAWQHFAKSSPISPSMPGTGAGPPVPSQVRGREGGSCSGCSWLTGAGPSSVPTKFLRAIYPAGWGQAPRIEFIPFQRERHKGTSQRCETSWRNKPRCQRQRNPSFKGTERVCAWGGGGKKNPTPRQLHLLGG